MAYEISKFIPHDGAGKSQILQLNIDITILEREFIFKRILFKIFQLNNKYILWLHQGITIILILHLESQGHVESSAR